MVRQSIAIGGRNMQVLAVAGLLAFCSPYPVRFAELCLAASLGGAGVMVAALMTALPGLDCLCQ